MRAGGASRAFTQMGKSSSMGRKSSIAKGRTSGLGGKLPGSRLSVIAASVDGNEENGEADRAPSSRATVYGQVEFIIPGGWLCHSYVWTKLL